MAHSKLYNEFLPKVGATFNGASEHWSERDAVKPLWKIQGEILEVRSNGICIDDGKGDETFVSFDTIAKHRAQLQRDYRADMDMILSEP